MIQRRNLVGRFFNVLALRSGVASLWLRIALTGTGDVSRPGD